MIGNDSGNANTGPRVAGLCVSPARHEPMTALQSAKAVADFGLEGDAHARPGSDRQMLLMDQESLDELDLDPGVIKENVTTAGLKLYELEPGSKLRIGTAVIQLTKPCPPCGKMEAIRLGLQEQLFGRRGYLARVVESGEIRVGDAIEPI